MKSGPQQIRFLWFSLLILITLIIGIPQPGKSAWLKTASAETEQTTPLDPIPPAAEQVKQVSVGKFSSDQAIDKRLTDILQSTGWFEDVEIEVRDGVVFLDGLTNSQDRREWARLLAGKTEDVVAVVNRIRVAERSHWDLTPATVELKRLWNLAVMKLPVIVIGLVILILAVLSAKLTAGGMRRALAGRLNPLLCDVTAKAVSIPIFILGIYIVLQVAGLSRLAVTVLGGTGLFGLVAGIAFRDILENFLASILISMRNPFKLGDLVEVAGHQGVIQRVTSRGTILMDLDGNHIQIPNSIIYKSVIRNFTANPNRRDCFEIGIGYENDSSAVQELAMNVLNNHPAVLKDPEALVLVDRLGSATVILKIYFWYDGAIYNFLKVKSSLIRLVKRAFEQEGISMPDEAREVIFPNGVPVHMSKEEIEPAGKLPQKTPYKTVEAEAVTTAAEGNLATEDKLLRDQASRARIPEEGASLLEE
jgi:small conductance mechanosensitive channel